MTKSTVFVGVHGIGDQVRNETIQAVARQVCAYCEEVSPGSSCHPALPLGAFPRLIDPTTGKKTSNYRPFFPPGLNIDGFGNVGFAEVYWADVTRRVEKAGYTLEESKRWARTLVEGVRAIDERVKAEGRKPKGYSPSVGDYKLMERVLDEMIDTLAVSDRLLGLARKLNLGEFNLKQVLDQFLGDVQFFAEFQDLRSEILNVFNDVLTEVAAAAPPARLSTAAGGPPASTHPEIQGDDDHRYPDIVLVAHSEGTVVAFMGLLQAATRPAGPEWLKQVRGLMTLGSPIDKHLFLWEDIWKDVQRPNETNFPKNPIAWWNYYDHGDPVGFELDTARDKLKAWRFTGTRSLFKFGTEQDIGFTRYPFAGKAHVDYWKDQKIFRHFLDSVKPFLGDAKGSVAASAQAQEQDQAKVKVGRPRTRPLALVSSYFLPYAVVAAVLGLAVYALTKGALEAGFINDIAWQNLVGYSSLLAGATIFARVPRLLRRWSRWLVAGLAFAAASVGYHFTVVTYNAARTPPLAPHVLWEDGLIAVALSVAIVSLLIVLFKPSLGMKPLVIVGTVVAVGLVWTLPPGQLAPAIDALAVESGPQGGTAPGGASAIWPILVGGAFFLYLWWLAALMFDLVFVWHRYIRHGATKKIMAQRWS